MPRHKEVFVAVFQGWDLLQAIYYDYYYYYFEILILLLLLQLHYF